MREARRRRAILAAAVVIPANVACCEREPMSPRSSASGTAGAIPPVESRSVSTEVASSAKPQSTVADSVGVEGLVLDKFDLQRYADLLAKLPVPTAECVPLGRVQAAYEAKPEECVYEVALAKLYDPSQCASDEDYCAAGVGAYFGRLVRLLDVEFTVTEDEPPKWCHSKRCEDAPSSWCCWKNSSSSSRYPCSGTWWGHVGVALPGNGRPVRHVLPIMSVGGYEYVECGRGWTYGKKFVPDAEQRPPRCQPVCAPWVWKKHTVVLRPTGLGLKLVVPPKGVDPKYLLSDDPLPAGWHTTDL